MPRNEIDKASDSRPAAERSPARLAVFVGVALATFAGGLYFFPGAVRGYVVRATVGVMPADDAPTTARESRQALQDVLLATDNLHTALRHIGPPARISQEATAEFPSEAEIDFVRQRLAVEPDPSGGMAGYTFAVSLTCQDKAWGTDLLERLIRQTIEILDERTAANASPAMLPDGEMRLGEARQREQAARQSLDNFLARHFAELNRASDSQDKTVGTKSGEPARRTPRINPKWQSLQDQLAKLTAQYERLLVDRTAEHPQAKEAALAIEAVRRQLEATGKFLPDEEGTASSNAEARLWCAITVQPAQFDQLDSSPNAAGRASSLPAGSAYERLMADFRVAREHRETLEQELNQASQAADLTNDAALPVVRGRIVSTAHLAQTLRAPPSIGRLTVLGLASIFAGACLASLVRKPRPRVYSTLHEIEASLSLPVLGVVPSSSASEVATSR